MVDELIVGQYYLFKLKRSELLALGTSGYARFRLGGETEPIIAYSQENSNFGMLSYKTKNNLYYLSFLVNWGTSVIDSDGLDTSFSTIGLYEVYTKEYILLYGKFYSYSTSSVLNDYLKEHAYPYSLLLDLGMLDAEKNYVFKDANGEVTYYETLYGNAREEIDIMNPSILIEYPRLPKYNYVSIYQFHRKYFVKNIVLVRNNLYRLELHVDVLNTYANIIDDHPAFISRGASYVDRFRDPRRPLYNIPTIDVLYPEDYETIYPDYDPDAPTDPDDPDYDPVKLIKNAVNTKIDLRFNSAYERYFTASFFVPATPTNHLIPTPTGLYPTNLSGIGTVSRLTCYTWAFTRQQIEYLTHANYMDEDTAKSCASIIAYPFDLDKVIYHNSIAHVMALKGTTTMYLKTTNYGEWKDTSDSSDVQAKLIEQNSLDYIVIADFTIPLDYQSLDEDNKTYLNYEPVTSYQMFIPFVGWVTLNALDFVGYRILVYYGIDVSTGFATAYVRNCDKDITIYSGGCQIGIKLPINISNQQEIERIKQNNVSNLTLGLIASGTSLAIGAVTENPVAMVSGVLSGAQAIKNYVNAENLLVPKTQGTFASTETAMYDAQEYVLIKRMRYEPVSIDEDIYANINGYPANEYGTIAMGDGYTEVGDIHFAPQLNDYITSDEIDEIVSLLKAGVIL